MANLDASTAEALNMLLEDERASVELEIAFANGATELAEREAYTAMGSLEVALCCALRDLLTTAGADVSLRINGIVLHIFSIDTYDDRLRAFAEHQLRVCETAERLMSGALGDRIRAPLEEICQAHRNDAGWCERRADIFAQSRLLDFRGGSDGAGLGVDGEMRAEQTAIAASTTGDPTMSIDDAGNTKAREQSPAERRRQRGTSPDSQRLVDSQLE